MKRWQKIFLGVALAVIAIGFYQWNKINAAKTSKNLGQRDDMVGMGHEEPSVGASAEEISDAADRAKQRPDAGDSPELPEGYNEIQVGRYRTELKQLENRELKYRIPLIKKLGQESRQLPSLRPLLLEELENAKLEAYSDTDRRQLLQTLVGAYFENSNLQRIQEDQAAFSTALNALSETDRQQARELQQQFFNTGPVSQPPTE